MVDAGINIIPDGPVEQIVELARQAESLGFKRCWVMDEGLVTRDVFVTMTAIGLATESIVIGTGITNPYTRHPAVTAAGIATLDEMTGGRAFLGLGAGGSLTLDPLAIKRVKPLTAVRETIDTTRALFRGETVTYQGQHVSLDGASIAYSRPDIEIWVAGRGPKMLQLGGEKANGVSLSFMHRDLIHEVTSLVRSGSAISGNEAKIDYAVYLATNDEMADRLRPYVTFSLVDSPQKAKDLIGISDEEVAEIRQVMGSQGLHAAGKLVRDEWLRPFTFMGSRAECAAGLTETIEKHGIDELVLPLFDLENAPDQLEEASRIFSIMET
jgi:5,10-methylenetetrahydromethanopterin reductase